MPRIEPETTRPGISLSSVTLAESVRTKSSGCCSMFSHWIPICVDADARSGGMPKLSPVAEPTLRKTPKPVFVVERPVAEEREVPRLAGDLDRADLHLRADGLRTTTSSCVASAPVSSLKSRAVSVTNVESLTSSVSTLNWKESTLPLLERQLEADGLVVRRAVGLRSSAVLRSVIVTEKVPPGKSFAPPDAT